MKSLLPHFLIFSLSIGILSCIKDDSLTKDKMVTDIDKVLGDIDCIAFLYPISITLPDETIEEIDNANTYDEVVKAWYKANPDSKEKFTFNYPIDVIFEGKNLTVNDENEMEKLKKFCDGTYSEYDKDDCISIIYPAAFTFPDGTTSTYDSNEKYEEGIKAWYKAHPNSKEEPSLNYPVDVIFGDKIITVNNTDEMEKLKKSCKDKLYDCPKLKGDIGDECQHDDGSTGIIDEKCECK